MRDIKLETSHGNHAILVPSILSAHAGRSPRRHSLLNGAWCTSNIICLTMANWSSRT